ncbi:hypothetical protein A2955_01675 [Candidatus Woesebacteria bacterium RIFCSPLOWO2_01_FULL_37_19]|uniref:Glycosyltransferase RgtA/B/C/D-like domain-containing protein n=2 Tax=Candidatus Woeseibacteriota TaxID=1752722 RepID=A0A1F8BAA1_9BACT|nr:MAG: hypothetical protein A2771_03860 [Candidatus Woesebacteria bacterium RIFCSPHIGHO2_01_FULL_38_26b]OGM60957.1 MAG: hypothetical protein A2955_01675 [Candidatus Woesebacteria bacterium RIFCSPLOWO2_01_FULL_37_19]
MSQFLKRLFFIILISFLPTLAVWLPFFFRLEKVWGIPLSQNGMATIVANYDGPLFIAVAKSLYNPVFLGNFGFDLPSSYFAAHFPLFPLLIRIFAVILGYPYSMLVVTLLSSILALYFFSVFIADFVEKKDLLWITIVFAILPARWLIVRSVGSAEPLFLASVIASVYYFRKEKYLSAGLWGVVAQISKSAGILLFIAYALALLLPKLKLAALTTFSKWHKSIEIKNILSVLLIPISLLGVFTLYKYTQSDFLAYFHSGDNIHLFFPPFQIFNYNQPWVGTFWLEEIIFVYLFGALGFLKLVKMQEYKIAWFVGIFFASTLFVSHRDLIRYSLPLVPFLYAAFAETIVKKEFKTAMLVLIIPIYLFSLAYISQNVMPVSDWAPFL